MIELEIILIDNNRYVLRRRDNFKKIELYFEFFEVEKPTIGSTICINKKLLDKKYKGYSQPYSFEHLLNDINDKFSPSKNENLIFLKNKETNYIMKRIYG